MDLRFEFRVLSKVVWKPASDSIDKKQENVTRSIISKEHKRLEVGA
jgi:F0F1-type ATP synthase membrane subunit b/b'